MSLRILFADDSVTAQNMGKKILTEAGYEVVAVSNGAAAVKKIAEQKPDIIILDVYMPGYSGLEVCEKVRGSMETMKTPVLLTVGKMEPYRPEDGNRVKADGVIVKPFEASDLLAIVKKFGERVVQKPAMVAQPVLVERIQQEIIEEPSVELPAEPVHMPNVAQPMVEVPDHMATASAFSDLLGTDSPVTENHFEPPAPAAVQEASVPSIAVPSAIPEYELPVSWREQEPVEEKIPAPAAAAKSVPFRPAANPAPFRAAADPVPFQAAADPVPFPTAAAPAPFEPAREPALEPEPVMAPAASRPLQIPVYQEQEPAAEPFEFMPTSAPATEEIEIPREPELIESAADATRNTLAEETEPGLLSTGRQFDATPAEVAAAEMAPVEEEFIPAGFQDIPAEIAAHLPAPAAEVAPVAAPEPPPAEPVSDGDFEARVAAALAAYSHAQEAPSVPPPVHGFVASTADVVHDQPAPAPEALQEVEEPLAEAASPAIDSPAPIVEPQAVVAAEVPDVPAAESQPVVAAPLEPEMALPEEEPAPQAELPPPVFEYHPTVPTATEAPLPQAVAPETSEAASFVSVPTQAEAEPVIVAEAPAVVEIPTAAAPEPPAPDPGAVYETHEPPAAVVETALPETTTAAAAAAAGAADSNHTDHHTIAQAVHRVMERLKPELVEEILRELKSKKD